MTFARLIASGFGCGYAPIAPGTVASIVAVVLGVGFAAMSPLALPLAALLATIGGIVAIRSARAEGDPGWIVIDEFAGQWIALLGLSHFSPTGLLAAFALFRLFDITKPGPVGWADRWHTPAGVMLDDVFAGIISAALLLAAKWAWPDLPF